jgi:hypothetical protein
VPAFSRLGLRLFSSEPRFALVMPPQHRDRRAAPRSTDTRSPRLPGQTVEVLVGRVSTCRITAVLTGPVRWFQRYKPEPQLTARPGAGQNGGYRERESRRSRLWQVRRLAACLSGVAASASNRPRCVEPRRNRVTPLPCLPLRDTAQWLRGLAASSRRAIGPAYDNREARHGRHAIALRVTLDQHIELAFHLASVSTLRILPALREEANVLAMSRRSDDRVERRRSSRSPPSPG